MKSLVPKLSVLTLAFVLFGIAPTGCNQKEKILDVETPRRELEIERDKTSGDVDVELHDKE